MNRTAGICNKTGMAVNAPTRARYERGSPVHNIHGCQILTPGQQPVMHRGNQAVNEYRDQMCTSPHKDGHAQHCTSSLVAKEQAATSVLP
jgi:hypothetical protein